MDNNNMSHISRDGFQHPYFDEKRNRCGHVYGWPPRADAGLAEEIALPSMCGTRIKNAFVHTDFTGAAAVSAVSGITHTDHKGFVPLHEQS